MQGKVFLAEEVVGGIRIDVEGCNSATCSRLAGMHLDNFLNPHEKDDRIQSYDLCDDDFGVREEADKERKVNDRDEDAHILPVFVQLHAVAVLKQVAFCSPCIDSQLLSALRRLQSPIRRQYVASVQQTTIDRFFNNYRGSV